MAGLLKEKCMDFAVPRAANAGRAKFGGFHASIQASAGFFTLLQERAQTA
jgi:hypothetical protein